MKRISTRVLAALLTFVVGVAATALWLFHFRLQPPRLDAASPDSIIQPINLEESEEYAIYSVVLNDERYADSRVKSVTIVDQTAGHPSVYDKERFSRGVSYVREKMPDLDQATLADYLSKNWAAQPLKDQFNLKVKAVLINAREVKSIFEEHSMDGWRIIFERYPNSLGLITISAVGFNHDLTQALVHVGISCGGLCGEGNLFLLRKENGVWQVQKKIMTWVS